MPDSLINQYGTHSELRKKLYGINITIPRIAEKAEVSPNTVKRVLTVGEVDSVRYGTVKRVRSAIMDLIPSFVSIHFDEYDDENSIT